MSLPQNSQRRRSLYRDTPAIDVHCGRQMMCESTTESEVAANQTFQGSTVGEQRLDILSARWESLKKDKTKSNTRKDTGIFSKLALWAVKRFFGSDIGHEECSRTNCELLDEAQHVARESASLYSRIMTLQGEIDAQKSELGAKKVEISRLKEQAREFREIFLAEAGNQKVSDDEVIQSFVKMRQRALSLAKNKALRFDRVPVLKSSTPQQVKDFYCNGAWNSWMPKDRELHVRAVVFRYLHHFILDTACFGIEEGFPAQPGRLGRIAQSLSDLEAMAKKKKLSTALLANWRLATLECVEALGIQERQSEHVVEELWKLLAPIIDDQSPSLVEGLRSLARNLCKDAFDLTIMMRKCRDEYRCDAIEDMVRLTTADLERWVDAHAVDEGKNSEAGEKVAYVLFGALTKKSAYDGGNKRVLVKAEVVMEKKGLR